MKRIWTVLISGMILAIALPPSHAGTIYLDDTLKKISVGRSMEYLADTESTLGIGDITNERYASRWKASNSEGRGFGFTKSVYWVRFTVENRASRPIAFFLEQEYALIDRLQLYVPLGGGFKVTDAGDYLPYAARPYDYRTFIFPLKLPGKSRAIYYMRYQSSSSMNIPLYAWSPEFFESKVVQENYLLLLFNGIVLVMAVYTLLLFLIIRWFEYLYFSMLLSSCLLFMGTQNGTAFRFLWPGSPWFANFFIPVLLCLVFIFILLFDIELLEIRRLRSRSPLRIILWKTSITLLCLNGILFIACLFLPYRYAMTATAVMAGVEIVYTFVVYSVLMIREKNRQASFALLVGLPIIASTVIYVLKTFSVLPTTVFTEWSVHFSIVFLAVLFSIILADKVNGLNRELALTHMNLIEKDAQVVLNEDRIFRLQHYDSLTELPNRNLFELLLQKEIFHARRLALICIGIDRFKYIRDLFGSSAGDGLLKAVAMKLKDVYFSKDVVARVDANRFMVLISSISATEQELNLDNLEKVVRKAQDISGKSFLIEGNDIQMSASIGLCLYPNDGPDADSLISNCESAVNVAQEKGGTTFHYFDAALNEKMLARQKLERELSSAIRRKEFLLHYQPKVDNDGRITGFEALVRWNSPDAGIVPPADFISLAEKNGMIIEIGRMVFEMACRQSVLWNKDGRDPLRIAVNLSPFQFVHADLLGDVRAIVGETGADPRHLEIEITESGIMLDEKDAINKLQEFRRMGFAISIDDFGTGYSSLSRLKFYPVDVLKIDRSLVESLPADRASAIIAETIISLGHNLGLKVVAEGIETSEQYEFLKELRCDYYQGFLFYRPLAPDMIEMIPNHAAASLPD